MIRFVLRSLGLWSLAGGFAAAVVDGTKSIAAAHVVTTSTLATWTELSPETLATATRFVGEKLGPQIWPILAATVLAVPAWALFGGIGAVLIALGRIRTDEIAAQP